MLSNFALISTIPTNLPSHEAKSFPTVLFQPVAKPQKLSCSVDVIQTWSISTVPTDLLSHEAIGFPPVSLISTRSEVQCCIHFFSASERICFLFKMLSTQFKYFPFCLKISKFSETKPFPLNLVSFGFNFNLFSDYLQIL